MGMDNRRRGGIGRPELITGLVMWILVGGIVFTSGYMPFWVDKSPGPRLMPIIIAVCTAILAVLYWIEAWRAGGGEVKFPGVTELKKPLGLSPFPSWSSSSGSDWGRSSRSSWSVSWN